MISINKQEAIKLFNNNLKMAIVVCLLWLMGFVVSVAPEMVVMALISVLSSMALAGMVVLTVRVFKSRKNFNVFDFFGIPRPGEKDTCHGGANPREVNPDES